MIITIDGPTASGKSTVARLVAHELGYYYIASGMLFRALAHVLLCEGRYSVDDFPTLPESVLERYMNKDVFSYSYDAMRREQIFYHGVAIAHFLKTPTIDQAASLLSLNPIVRQHMLTVQRAIASSHDVVADGRDCGSVVFPNADRKIFLTANRDARAQRWQKDQQDKGLVMSLKQAQQELRVRDERDSLRTLAPLIIPKGAFIIDSSAMLAQEVAACIVKRAHGVEGCVNT